MDIKTTEYDVTANQILCEQITEQAIDTEFSMPEYCAAVSRILNCKIDTFILSRSLQGAKLQIEAMAEITVFYADAENRICTWQHSQPFVKTTDLPQEVAEATFKIKVKTGHTACKAVAEKKFSVHASVAISVLVMQCQRTRVLSAAECPFLEQELQHLPGANLVATAEKYVLVEDMLDIGADQPAVEKILYAKNNAIINDCKVVGSKLVVKGEVYTDVLYATDTGALNKLQNTIPFSQIIDVHEISEQCSCDAGVEVCGGEFKARTNLTGEVRSVSVQAKLFITAYVYSEQPIPLLKDAYSTKNICKVQQQPVLSEEILDLVNEHFLCKKTLEFTQNGVAQIADIWCDTHCNTVQIEEKALCIYGTVTVCLLAYDSDHVPNYVERPIDFTYKYALNTAPPTYRCIPQILSVAVEGMLAGQDKLEFKADLLIRAMVFAQHRSSAVVQLEVSDELQSTEEASAILCLAKKGESVWDIAKRYATCKQFILQHNAVDEILKEDKMLVIPIVS